MTNTILEANKLGQSIWYDNISRSLIKSGELKDLIALGVSGITSNPTIFEKAISNSSDYDADILEATSLRLTPTQTYYHLAKNDIRDASDLLLPVYYKSNGLDGYISLEVNPVLSNSTAQTITEAIELFKILQRPNIMIKVPATDAGIPAIRELIKEGVNLNVTLIFSLSMYRKVMNSYIAGLEDRLLLGKDIDKISSVASFFVSRIDTKVDPLIYEATNSNDKPPTGLLGFTAIANASLAYHEFQNTFKNSRFNKLKENGANVQKPLWASTGTKNKNYSDVHYIESLIGLNTVNTMPPQTIKAFLNHGKVSQSLGDKVIEATKILDKVSSLGINLDSITDQLLIEGVDAFTYSFKTLIENISRKMNSLSNHI